LHSNRENSADETFVVKTSARNLAAQMTGTVEVKAMASGKPV
jgi:hypothetical protein